MLQKYAISLEERRDRFVIFFFDLSKLIDSIAARLRDLLEEEEAGYMTEMEAKKETTIERQAKMRERAKQLKERRESERQALAEMKLEQRWRDQCEEMRSLLVKRNQDEVCIERAEQVRLKKEEQERQRQSK